jgi:Nucleotidyl transferase AbiEii toxin, Type IV TA system
MSADLLTPLQWRVLRGMAAAMPQLFLSGGAALAGFHLKHRPTTDLDFFTTDRDAMAAALGALRDVATSMGATVEIRQQTPSFVRALVHDGTDALLVDIVHEQVSQLHAIKPVMDGIAVDPMDEIFVNTLTALVGRQEERDLVDVWFMEQRGLRVEDALAAAHAKDGGCTPATLAWLLTSYPIPPDGRLPRGLTSSVLKTWRDELIDRLLRCALPA